MPERSQLLFAALLLVVYTAIPVGISLSGSPDSAYRLLSTITVVGVAVMVFTFSLARIDLIKVPQIAVDSNLFLFSVVGVFVGFALLSWATAEQIPIVAAIQGADGETLAYLRENFLKGRGGWQSGFVYVNAILSGALLPYCIAIMFLSNHRFKWLVFSFFLIYSISFVEKAFFIKAIVPVFYLLCQRRIRSRIQPSVLAVASVLILLAFTVLSRAGETGWSSASGDFFTPAYRPGNSLDQLVWRAVSVPVFSAIDAIKVYETFFNYPLMGATSSFLSLVTGSGRVEFERMVFAFEWGQNATGTGSANSVFLTEAYINFGWTGIVVFSAMVGLCLRIFAASRDEGVRSLWLLFCFNLFSAGLVGLLFSNGFIVLLLLATFTRLDGVPMLPSPEAAGPRTQSRARRRAMPWERPT